MVEEMDATLNSRVKRPVDLARAAGVSTQQVRNLEALGVLPEAGRTESGYRRYGSAHLSALLAYQALVPGFGAPGTRRILVAVAQGRLDEALELIDEGHAGLHEARRSLTEITGTLVGLSGPVIAGGEAATSDSHYDRGHDSDHDSEGSGAEGREGRRLPGRGVCRAARRSPVGAARVGVGRTADPIPGTHDGLPRVRPLGRA